MAGSLDSNVFLVLGIVAALYFLAERLLSIKLDPKEPPLIAPKVPFIGHILGLIQYGTGYYAKLWYCAQLPFICRAYAAKNLYQRKASPSNIHASHGDWTKLRRCVTGTRDRRPAQFEDACLCSFRLESFITHDAHFRRGQY